VSHIGGTVRRVRGKSATRHHEHAQWYHKACELLRERECEAQITLRSRCHRVATEKHAYGMP
jgi:hypothetical protein